MTAHSQEDGSVILHVVPYDVSRGAERYARSLVDVMNETESDRHVLMTMFEGEEQSLDADLALDVPRGLPRRLGFDPRVILRLRKAVERLRPGCVVAHGGESAKYAALALRGEIPFAYLVIGSNHPLLDNPLRRLMRDFYLSRAAAVVTVSSGLADEMRAAGVPDETLHVVPNGRDPDRFLPGEPSAREVSRLLFVGRLDDQKRPLLFVSTFAEIRARGLLAAAMMVGGGPLYDSVSVAASQVGIEVLGPRDDVPALLAQSDLLVLTSRPPEGMPGVLIEAGLSGLATVTTDVPGARDVVIDGLTGFVVGVDDETGLADAVEKLLVDDRLRAEMGRAARERCVTEFSLEASAEGWRRVLDGVTS